MNNIPVLVLLRLTVPPDAQDASCFAASARVFSFYSIELLRFALIIFLLTEQEEQTIYKRPVYSAEISIS